MKKIIRYTLKTLAWILGLLVFIWLALWAYVELNQARLIQKISRSISAKTHGEVAIGSVSVSLIRTFPVLSLQLSDVALRDSIYPVHKKNFLTAGDIYLRISLRDMLKGRPAVGRITVNNARLEVFTDSLGRSNEYILSGRKSSEGETATSIPEIVLNSFTVCYENLKKNKRYAGTIRKMKCAIATNEQFVLIDANLNAQIDGLAFNTKKGSYLKNSQVRGHLQLSYNKIDHDLLVNHILLSINDHPFLFDGYFRIDKALSDFNLTISTSDVDFKNATALLNDTLQTRFDGYRFSKPIAVQVTVYGQTVSNYGPDVRIKMALDMSGVEMAAGITFLKYTGGRSDVDITIVSSELAKDTINGDLNGTVKLKDVEIKYQPKNFLLTGCTGRVAFNRNDVLIDSLQARAGQTRLLMNGRTHNLFTLGSPDDLGKLNLHWKIYSPEIHIKDFTPLLSKGNFGTKQSNLDKLFSNGDIYVQVNAAKMNYNHFHASNITGQLILQASGIKMKDIFFNNAGGSMQINGALVNGSKTNPVNLQVKMQRLDVPKLFAAFDNFGQNAVTKDDLNGTLSANVNFETSITNDAKIVGADSKGSVSFLLQDGQLINFLPLIEAGKKAFKKQDLTNIKFAELKNRLDISGTTFIINPMEIRSTAFTLFAEGVYDIKKGSDISIRFPLRNLTKSQAATDLNDDAKARKGLGLRLRAKTGDDGKLKISWDPFKKAIKNKNQLQDSMRTDK